jgi:hypothetical protein
MKTTFFCTPKDATCEPKMPKMQGQSHNMEPFVSRMRHKWAHVEPAGTQAGTDGATRCLNGGPLGGKCVNAAPNLMHKGPQWRQGGTKTQWIPCLGARSAMGPIPCIGARGAVGGGGDPVPRRSERRGADPVPRRSGRRGGGDPVPR